MRRMKHALDESYNDAKRRNFILTQRNVNLAFEKLNFLALRSQVTASPLIQLNYKASWIGQSLKP